MQSFELKNILEIIEIFNFKEEILPKWEFSTDTREKQDSWFIGIKGKNFDGTLFFKQALESGAKGLILNINSLNKTDYELCKTLNLPVIFVKDTLKAYQTIANHHRKNLNCKVIGITGSNGKTTVKEILKTCIQDYFKVVATEANENNEIGVAKTILRADKTTDILIVEMGMRQIGEIKELTHIAEPEIAVITNIGNSHIGILGSKKAIANAKSEIFYSPQLKFILLPKDEKLVYPKSSKHIFFGTAEKLEIYENKINFVYRDHEFSMNTYNHSVINNACIVIDICKELGLNYNQIKQGLSLFSLTKGRGEIIKLNSGAILLDESYNANPDSMKILAKSMSKIPNSKKKILIMGEMAELGEAFLDLYKEMVEEISGLLDLIILQNGENQEILKELFERKKQKVLLINSQQEILEYIQNQKLLKENNILGFKGSRIAKLDELIEKIKNEVGFLLPNLV